MNERQANTLVVTLVTATNLLIAFLISGIVIWVLGENPWFALNTMLYGAFGYDEGLGYTLYYSTNFIFHRISFCDRIPLRIVQYRCRRAGLHWWTRSWFNLFVARKLVALAGFSTGSSGFNNIWRSLGSNTGIFES